MLDREYVAEASAERKIIRSGSVAPEEVARLSQQLAADFLLVGTLDTFGYTTSERTMRTSDRKIRTGRGSAVFGYRLIEAATQQTVVSNTAEVTITDADVGRSASSSATVKALADALARKVSGEILDQIYPTLIIAVNGSEVVLGEGGKGLNSGSRYKVYRYGEKMYDSYTKEYLGRQEHFCCTIEVTRVLPKQSYGTVLEDNFGLAANFTAKTFILREPVPVASTRNDKAVVEAHSRKIQARREEADDDW